jgi:hypothetical protein
MANNPTMKQRVGVDGLDAFPQVPPVSLFKLLLEQFSNSVFFFSLIVALGS